MQFQNSTKMSTGQGTGQPLHILVCPDQPSWAFDNIANNIARYAGRNKISKLYMSDVIDNEHLFFEAILLKRIDLCHIFWREDLFYLLHPRTINKAGQHLGLDYETMVRAINSCAFTTSVYDHLFSGDDDIQNRRSNFALIDGYTVSSKKLQTIYASAPGIPAPDGIISDGVDVDHFSQGEIEHSKKDTFTIGWVGNSAWGKQSQGFDVKGYHRLFQPMMADLTKRDFVVSEKVADPQLKHIPFEEMPDFYRSVDVFVCTSAMEGTPNPVLEAMACGIPVVSTDVGIVSEAFGDLQKRFIFNDPTPDCLATAVVVLLEDEQLRRAISKENRSRTLDWSWEIKTKDWWPFWIRVVNQAMAHRNAIRRETCLLSAANSM